MKPAFALTFEDDSITLLHRSGTSWVQLGTVALADPDLPGALAALRTKAQTLATKGLFTKVVIPNTEILYLTVHAPGPKAAQRRAQIAAALEGRTPYGLDELTFDWSGTGETVQVAVVARETLAEAESFAADHAFNPVSLVARPEAGTFAAEPWFGLTAQAAELLGPGEKVVRDQDPIRIAQKPGTVRESPVPEDKDETTATPAAAQTPVAEAEPASDPEIEGAAPEAPETVAPAPVAAVEPESPQAPEPGGETAQAIPASDGQPAPADPGQQSEPDRAPSVSAAPDEAPASTATTVPEQDEPAMPEPVAAEPPVHSVPPAETVSETGAEPPAAEPGLPTRTEEKPDTAAVSNQPIISDQPMHPSAPQETAKDDGGTGPEAGMPPAPALPDTGPEETQSWPGEDEPARLSDAKAALAASLAPPPMPEERVLAKALHAAPQDDIPPPVSATVLRALQQAKQSRPASRPEGAEDNVRPPVAASAKLSEKMQKALSRTAKPAKPKAKPPVTRVATGPGPLPVNAGQASLPPPRSEAEAMTVFGRRRDQPVGGKPRFLGLALSGLLLLVLVLVAVWASYFLEPPRDSALPVPEDATQVAQTAPADEPVAVAQTAPAAEPEPVAEAAPAPETAEPAMQAEAQPETMPDEAAVPPSEPSEMADAAPVAESAPVPAEPETAPATADTVQDVAASARRLEQAVVEELTLPLPDPVPVTPPAVRLAPIDDRQADAQPQPPAVLPEFGALYQFDAEGNIVPTPEGVVTPDGVRLVAGRPTILPPPRPTAQPAPVEAALPQATPDGDEPAVAAAAPPETAIDPAPAETGEVGTAFVEDDRFRGERPRQRPAGLVQDRAEDGPVADEEGALPETPETSTQFARRPSQRPDSVVAEAARQVEAEQARRLADAAAAAALAASTAALSGDGADPGASALAATRRPPQRPANFSAAIEAAVAAVIAPPTATTRPAAEQRASAAPAVRADRGARASDLEDEEPDTAAAVPSAPTRASVARQATESNVLNLGRTNLIGVFGTASSRYALVRESGGRLVRVKVGDRVDGGRVVAIGQGDLRYQKGGQTVQLRMPRG